MQKMNFIPQVFLEALQKYANFLFWVLWACLTMHTQNDSITRRKNRCISLCQRWTSSFTFFLRYYILKNLVIWMADNILDYNSRTRILPIWDWWWNINNNISFQFWLFPRKTNDRIFQKKNLKKTHFGLFWALFSKCGQKWILPEKRALSDFRYSKYLPSCKKSEKTNKPFPRKIPNWQTVRQTTVIFTWLPKNVFTSNFPNFRIVLLFLWFSSNISFH